MIHGARGAGDRIPCRLGRLGGWVGGWAGAGAAAPAAEFARHGAGARPVSVQTSLYLCQVVATERITWYDAAGRL